MNMDEECKMSMEYPVQPAINKITATKFKEVLTVALRYV